VILPPLPKRLLQGLPSPLQGLPSWSSAFDNALDPRPAEPRGGTPAADVGSLPFLPVNSNLTRIPHLLPVAHEPRLFLASPFAPLGDSVLAGQCNPPVARLDQANQPRLVQHFGEALDVLSEWRPSAGTPAVHR